jgi:hypothetical protein
LAGALLLLSRRVLAPALTARSDRPRRGTGAGVAHHAADDGASRRAARTGARGGAGGGRRRRRGGRCLGRIEAGLLDGPRVAGGLVALLLLGRLPLGGVHVLLRTGRHHERRGNREHAKASSNHVPSWLSTTGTLEGSIGRSNGPHVL